MSKTIVANSEPNVDSTPAPTEKKRGRPPGAIREVFFSMAALVDGELVHELIQVTRGEKITHEEMSAEARKIFLNKHKTDAESEFGPIFKASLMQATSNKRQTVRMSEAEINFSKRKAQAVYNGWEVIARYIEDDAGNENTESVKIFYVKDLEAKGDKSRVRPQPTIKFISDLKDIKELSPASST